MYAMVYDQQLTAIKSAAHFWLHPRLKQVQATLVCLYKRACSITYKHKTSTPGQIYIYITYIHICIYTHGMILPPWRHSFPSIETFRIRRTSCWCWVAERLLNAQDLCIRYIVVCAGEYLSIYAVATSTTTSASALSSRRSLYCIVYIHLCCSVVFCKRLTKEQVEREGTKRFALMLVHNRSARNFQI